MPIATRNNSPWAGYDKAGATPNCRSIILASGEVGTGKTRFALTAPGPILVQSLDKGLEGVVEPILAEMPNKEIYVREYDWNPQAEDFSMETAQQLRDRIIADFMHALKHARTIVWDKETDVRSVFQYAEFGGPAEGGNIKDYDRLNQRYFHLINAVKSHPGVNAIFIQAMKDEWGKGADKVDRDTGKVKKSFEKTGRRIRAGFDRMDELVFNELHFVRENGEFTIQTGKVRQNGTLSDQTFPGMTFAEFGQLLMPDTEESDWQ